MTKVIVFMIFVFLSYFLFYLFRNDNLLIEKYHAPIADNFYNSI